MSKTILIMGESGSGKTTSMRNLDPKTTFYFDCDRKGLNWKGWREQYNLENKNYVSISDSNNIKNLMSKIDKDQKQIKTVVIDTLNGIMIDDEFARMKEKGYDKWQDLAYSIYDLVVFANSLRQDLTIIFIMHSQTDRDDSGFYFTRAKTSGKKLDKITIESKVSTVILAKCINGKYVFEIKNDNSTVKVPMGAFENIDTIENDINIVLEALKEY